MRKIQLTLDSSKLKEFTDDNFKFNENGRNISKQVENPVGKGEFARYEQFLLFPVFSKNLYFRHVKTRAYFGKGRLFTKLFTKILDFSKLKAFADDNTNVTQKLKFA